MIKRKEFKQFSLVLIALCFAGSLISQALPAVTALGDTILVEIGSTYITNRDLVQKINTLPTMQVARFKTLDGQRQILEMMITEAVFYQKALELGIDQLPEVQNAIFISSQPVANDIYFENLLSRERAFDPRTVERFYYENIDLYTVPPRVMIQHLQTTQDGLEAVLEAFSNDEDFSEIIENHSTNQITAAQRGIIRNIRLNGFIAGIGQDPELDVHIAEAAVDLDRVYGPFETDTGIHFFRKLDLEPAIIRPFSEIASDLEVRLRGQWEHEIYSDHIAYLFDRYNVVFMTDLLEGINALFVPEEMKSTYIVQSSHPEVRMTLGDVERVLRNPAHREMSIDLTNTNIQQMLIRTDIDRRLLNAASMEANIFELYANRYEMQEVRMRVILSYYHNTEIVNKVEVSRDELLEYYENNTERYTVPANRSIRQFVSADERTARRHRNAISKMLNNRRDQTDKIVEYITNESLMGHNGGLLNYIYQNNIVPTVGVDEVYNRMIFEARIGRLSEIFRNVNDEVVFFYVTEEIPARVRPLSDVENSLMGILHRQKVNELFEQKQEELLNEFNVVTHFDRISHILTAEQLFNQAELTQRMGQIQETIHYFEQIASDYAGTEYAYRALFMKGFMATEHFEDKEIAIQAFRELLEKFPEGELNESARFMLDELEGNLPLDMMFQN